MATAAIILRHLILALLSVLALSNGKVVSKEEYLKMKKYLRYINRPHVKSIKTEYGQIFDCVDVYKQPTMDHPLMKNHTIQMRPSYIPPSLGVAPLKSETRTNITLNRDDKCPPGTTPILRVQMEDLLRAGSVSKFVSRDVSEVNPSTHRYAGMQLKAGEKRYFGTGVGLNVWNPKVEHRSQFSLAQTWIQNGEGAETNTIEVGWQVYPRNNKKDGQDSEATHIFIYWTTDNYVNTGCYNLRCKGFVQLPDAAIDLVPGAIFQTLSKKGDRNEQFIYKFDVYKDRGADRHWWLVVHKLDGKAYPIGYWASEFFTKLGESADRISWGGETIRGELSTYPIMGTGEYADQKFANAAFVSKISLFDENNARTHAPTEIANYHVFQTEGCCTFLDMGLSNDDFGRYFYYGGPGGKCDGGSSAEPLLQVV